MDNSFSWAKIDKDNVEEIKEKADDRMMLGECYLHGHGVERDVEKTVELWESECVDHTSVENMYKLAHLYADGIEMEPDYEKAEYWWWRLVGAESDDWDLNCCWPEAMYQCACNHYEGKGEKKDINLALKCFKLTIDSFYRCSPHAPSFWNEKDNCKFEELFQKYSGKLPISEEPQCVINARRMLVKHGKKSIINVLQRAAKTGDAKAKEILEEFGIELIETVPAKKTEEKEKQPVKTVNEKPVQKSPIEISVGKKVVHKSFGEGIVCQNEDNHIIVDFINVGKKTFVNPDAFEQGYLIK